MGKSSRKRGKATGEAQSGELYPEGPGGPDDRRFLQQPVVHVILIIVIGCLAYSNTLQSPFQFDDAPHIAGTSLIRDLGNFISSTKGYDYNPRRFIGYLTFALNYRFGGLEVTGYHAVNLAIHVLNAVLVYFLVFLTFRTPYFSSQRSAGSNQLSTKHQELGTDYHHLSRFTFPDSRLIAFFSSLLFVAHPIQTQAVTYIVQRFASLATLFYLLSLVMYIKGRLKLQSAESAAQSVKKALPYALCSLLSAVLAMKTKEIAFTLPVVITVYEFAFFRSPLKKKLLFLLPVVIMLIIVPLSVLNSDKPLGELLSDVSKETRVQTSMPRWDYLMTEMRVIVTYIRLIFLPINQNVDYDYPTYHSFFSPDVFMSFLFLLALFGTALYLMYKTQSEKLNVKSQKSKQTAENLSLFTFHLSRLIAFGIFWFFITLSVESSIIPIVDVIFEHRCYLPSVGMFVAVATAAVMAAQRLKMEKVFIAAIALTVMTLTGITYARNAVWANEVSLWEDAVRKSPNKERPHNNLGTEYYKKDRLDEALREFLAASRLSPADASIHNNLGNAYYRQGRFDEALGEYQTALRLKPDYAEAHNYLGNVYGRKGRPEEAIREYQISMKLNADYAEAHNNLGTVYQGQGRLVEARREYETALRLKPDYADAMHNLSVVGDTVTGSPKEAIKEYQSPVNPGPDSAETHNMLGKMYGKRGQLDEALREYQTALRIDPGYAAAHNGLGNVYGLSGRLDKAIGEYRTALRLNPDFADAHNNLGTIFHRQGRLKEARREYETALRLNPDFAGAGKNLEILNKTAGSDERNVKK